MSGDSTSNDTINLLYESDGNQRLDQYLAENLPEFSRVRIKKLIDSGMVLVNGQQEKASLKLRGGERISIEIPPVEPSPVTPEDLNLDVIYEDEDLLVVNKPTGMVTHPGAGVFSGTLVNGLLHHCKGSLSGISGEERPGIVHRLDKDTSGLLVVAKNDIAHRSLAGQIQEKSARRQYLALVDGALKEDHGEVDLPIGRHRIKRKEMCIADDGRPARTIYKVRSRYHKITYLDNELKTGRTHQIRVHMAHLGNPVLGDLVYNKKGTGTEKARKRFGLKGHALHATSISFIHPVSGKLLEFTCEPSSDFRSLLNRLESGWR
ncbi:MAG: RluA family pseudouridine synthase [Cyanobacteriota/Melainabacteria group bacterium]